LHPRGGARCLRVAGRPRGDWSASWRRANSWCPEYRGRGRARGEKRVGASWCLQELGGGGKVPETMDLGRHDPVRARLQIRHEPGTSMSFPLSRRERGTGGEDRQERGIPGSSGGVKTTWCVTLRIGRRWGSTSSDRPACRSGPLPGSIQGQYWGVGRWPNERLETGTGRRGLSRDRSSAPHRLRLVSHAPVA
jgi:hypothetical protein